MPSFPISSLASKNMYIITCPALTVFQVNYSNMAILMNESEERFRPGQLDEKPIFSKPNPIVGVSNG
jgi:hypothetical protein